MRIIYQPAEGPAAVLVPVIPQYTAEGVLAPEQLDIVQIGTKDVPSGLPFWVVSAESVPTDRTMRDAWVLDVGSMGEPDGVGARQ